MPKVPTSLFTFSSPSLFTFSSHRHSNQSTPIDSPAMPKVPNSLPTFSPYRRNNQETPQSRDPATTAFASAAQRYVPRPLGDGSQRDAIFMHPLAGEWPIDTAPTAMSVPKPMDIEAIHARSHQSPPPDKPAPTTDKPAPTTDIEAVHSQSHQSPPPDKPAEFPISPPAPTVLSVPQPMDLEAPYIRLNRSLSPDKPVPTAEAPQSLACIDTLPGEFPISPPTPVNIPLPPIQMSTSSAPVPAQPVSDAASPTPQLRDKPIIQFIQRRHNIGSRVKVIRRDTHADTLESVAEKTRLVEQPDLTTRRIIENKDRMISELESQV